MKITNKNAFEFLNWSSLDQTLINYKIQCFKATKLQHVAFELKFKFPCFKFVKMSGLQFAKSKRRSCQNI